MSALHHLLTGRLLDEPIMREHGPLPFASAGPSTEMARAVTSNNPAFQRMSPAAVTRLADSAHADWRPMPREEQNLKPPPYFPAHENFLSGSINSSLREQAPSLNQNPTALSNASTLVGKGAGMMSNFNPLSSFGFGLGNSLGNATGNLVNKGINSLFESTPSSPDHHVTTYHPRALPSIYGSLRR